VTVTPTKTETILPLSLSLSKSHLPHFNDVVLVQSNAVLVAVLQQECPNEDVAGRTAIILAIGK
jgi:hypothetical protein